VAVELFIYMLCFVSTGLICKACSLGLVHFTGETLSVSFQKFCSTNGPDLVRVGVVTVQIMSPDFQGKNYCQFQIMSGVVQLMWF